MLTEMAAMSDDELVMQIHPGSLRNNRQLFERFGRDMGADIPTRTDYVQALKPLLDRFGNEAVCRSFCLRSTKAPMRANWRRWRALSVPQARPGMVVHDSPEGHAPLRQMTTETAGYNTVGFNDDTRAFLSIARHDVARRVDCGFLAQLVVEHRIEDWRPHWSPMTSPMASPNGPSSVRLAPDTLVHLPPMSSIRL